MIRFLRRSPLSWNGSRTGSVAMGAILAGPVGGESSQGLGTNLRRRDTRPPAVASTRWRVVLVVEQDTLRRTIEIVELAAAQGPQERSQAQGTQEERDRDQVEQAFHGTQLVRRVGQFSRSALS